MKKIMYTLATIAVMALATACGNHTPKATEVEEAVDSTTVVVDSTLVEVAIENVAE